MTDEERSLTLAAIDAAYDAQVGKLFGVLCSATDADIKSGEAAERFEAGLRRALDQRDTAIGAMATV